MFYLVIKNLSPKDRQSSGTLLYKYNEYFLFGKDFEASLPVLNQLCLQFIQRRELLFAPYP